MRTFVCPKCDSNIHKSEELKDEEKIFCSGCGHGSAVYTFSEIQWDANNPDTSAKFKRLKSEIKDAATDNMGKFLYYDRKEDDELQLYDIEDAILMGVISIKDIVSIFHSELTESVQSRKEKNNEL